MKKSTKKELENLVRDLIYAWYVTAGSESKWSNENLEGGRRNWEKKLNTILEESGDGSDSLGSIGSEGVDGTVNIAPPRYTERALDVAIKLFPAVVEHGLANGKNHEPEHEALERAHRLVQSWEYFSR